MSYPISELIQKRITREVGEEKPLSPARNSYKSPLAWSPNLGRGKTKHHSARLRTEEDGAGRDTKHKSG